MPTSAALASLFTLQRFEFLKSHLKNGPTTVLIIDHGEVQFSVSVVQLRQAEDEGVGIQVLSSVCVKDKAGLSMDEALFDHFSKQCAEKYGASVTRTSRVGQRLLKSCRKVKQTLNLSLSFVSVTTGGERVTSCLPACPQSVCTHPRQRKRCPSRSGKPDLFWMLLAEAKTAVSISPSPRCQPFANHSRRVIHIHTRAKPTRHTLTPNPCSPLSSRCDHPSRLSPA